MDIVCVLMICKFITYVYVSCCLGWILFEVRNYSAYLIFASSLKYSLTNTFHPPLSSFIFSKHTTVWYIISKIQSWARAIFSSSPRHREWVLRWNNYMLFWSPPPPPSPFFNTITGKKEAVNLPSSPTNTGEGSAAPVFTPLEWPSCR